MDPSLQYGRACIKFLQAHIMCIASRVAELAQSLNLLVLPPTCLPHPPLSPPAIAVLSLLDLNCIETYMYIYKPTLTYTCTCMHLLNLCRLVGERQWLKLKIRITASEKLYNGQKTETPTLA